MICQRCGEKEATIHLTKIINGEKTEVYLCEDCAEETGHLTVGNDPFSFQNLLSDILNPNIESIASEKKTLQCKNCGLSYKEFSQKGLFGCSECYQQFSDKIDRVAKRIHGSNRHTGKVPKRRGGKLRTEKKIEELKIQMQQAVEEENFEKAAELRDEIHRLEDKLRGDDSGE